MKSPPKPTTVHSGANTQESKHFSTFCIGLIEVTRPVNCIITFLSVLLGGWLGTLTVSIPLLLAAISASLITGGGNVFNDLCGIAEDQINKPQRPLPSGRLTTTSAKCLTVFLLASGLILGYTLPSPSLFIASLAVAGLILYNVWLKRVPLAGNLLVGILGGLAFLYGGFASQAHHPALWPALFATIFHLGREILKDLEDVEGDQLLSGSTLPLSWGKRPARTTVFGLFLVLIILLPLPAIIDLYGNVYLAIVGFLALLLIYILIKFSKDAPPQTLARLNLLLKAGMIIGLSAFFFDRLMA